MNQKITCAISLSLCVLTGSFFLQNEKGVAQIVPDNSLGTESSTVVPNVTINGIPAEQIEGGARRGDLLFHSFEDFNVEAGEGAYFLNPAAVNTIFSRVTGANVSNVFGTLGVLGDADLVFLNPQGILFGPAARLDLRGAFTGTTADGIVFADGSTFHALSPEVPAALSVNVQAPVGLIFEGSDAGQIVNQGMLSVGRGQRLNLVGGEIAISGGGLKAPSGRVELVGVSAETMTPALLSLDVGRPGFSLEVPETVALANVTLSDGAIVDTDAAEGDGGGAVNIQGARVTIQDESRVSADTFVDQTNEAVGVLIRGDRILVEGGAQISASVNEVGSGQGSGVVIQAREFVEVSGTSSASQNRGGRGEEGGNNNDSGGRNQNGQGNGQGNNGSGQGNGQGSENAQNGNEKPSKIASDARGTGTAGTLLIEAPRVTLQAGGRVSSSATERSQGATVEIRAANVFEVIGTAAERQRSSSISIQTRNDGTSGQLIIDTPQVRVLAGGEISASTFGSQPGGNIVIEASDGSVEVSGASADGVLVSRITSETGRPLDTRDGGLVAGTGDGGDIAIATGRLRVSDAGEVSVSGFGDSLEPGNAGDLAVNARLVELDNQGKITAFTRSGDGGNISFSGLTGAGEMTSAVVADELAEPSGLSLILRRNSIISTSGGEGASVGDGGNISFDGDFIFAVPQENSDITSNAFTGTGGEIRISARNVFGIESRDALTTLSDITASSTRGTPGVITIDTLELDPTQGLATLPEEPRETEIIDSCQASVAEGVVTFFDLGQGGFLPGPDDVTETYSIGHWISPDSVSLDSVVLDRAEPEERIDDIRSIALPSQAAFSCSRDSLLLQQ